MTYFSTILYQSENRHWKEKWKKFLKNSAQFFSISDKSEIYHERCTERQTNRFFFVLRHICRKYLISEEFDQRKATGIQQL